MKIGLLARADDGGLGAQSWLYAKHLRPERILICHTEHNTRGRARPERFQGFGQIRTCRRAPRIADAMWLVDGSEAVMTAECWYGTEIPRTAATAGVRSVIFANPEMSGEEMASDWYAHTDWRLDALHRPAKVIPMPTDPEILPRREPGMVGTFYHVSSPAMCDRNGTELVLKACEHVGEFCRLLIRGGDRGNMRLGKVEVEWLGHHDGLFFEAWPDEADALVLPRRYGGLCLPMLEAATLGLPILSLDLPPQNVWLPRGGLISAAKVNSETMRGGVFDIYGCNPEALGRLMTKVIQEPTFAAELAAGAAKYADAVPWSNLMPHFVHALGVTPDRLANGGLAADEGVGAPESPVG